MTNKEFKLGPVDPHNSYSVYAAAMSLLAIFADTLLEVIDAKLSPLYGNDWQDQLVGLELLEEDQNLRDVHALLKELSRNGMSQLRMPLKERIAKKEAHKLFFDELANILAERNAWVHRHVQETRDELRGLAELIRMVSSMAELKSTSECENLLSLLDKSPSPRANQVIETPDIKKESPVTVEVPTKHWNFGDPIHTQFTSHSYTVTEEFDVIDRVSEMRLSSINPSTLKTLNHQLQQLRSGSRLRITKDGVLSAFFAENWGFVAQVNAEDWFPKHLQNV